MMGAGESGCKQQQISHITTLTLARRLPRKTDWQQHSLTDRRHPGRLAAPAGQPVWVAVSLADLLDWLTDLYPGWQSGCVRVDLCCLAVVITHFRHTELPTGKQLEPSQLSLPVSPALSENVLGRILLHLYFILQILLSTTTKKARAQKPHSQNQCKTDDISPSWCCCWSIFTIWHDTVTVKSPFSAGFQNPISMISELWSEIYLSTSHKSLDNDPLSFYTHDFHGPQLLSIVVLMDFLFHLHLVIECILSNEGPPTVQYVFVYHG